MSLYSETIGSFVRTGSYPLEADFIFNSLEELEEWAENNVNIIHEGLFKIVINEQGLQLYWATRDGDSFVFTLFLGGVLEREITALNLPGSIGHITNGTVLPKGMSFTEFLTKMLIKAVKGTYSLSITGSSNTEVGTNFTQAIGTYTKNLGGDLITSGSLAPTATITGFTGNSGATVTASGNKVTITFSGRLREGTNSITSTIYYGLSSDFPAGSLSASASVTGVRKSFYGAGTPPSTSTDIRKGTSVNSSGTVTVKLPVNKDETWIAILASKRITQIKDTSATGQPTIDLSSLTQVGTNILVSGATPGNDTTPYNTYLLKYGNFSDGVHNLSVTIS